MHANQDSKNKTLLRVCACACVYVSYTCMHTHAYTAMKTPRTMYNSKTSKSGRNAYLLSYILMVIA